MVTMRVEIFLYAAAALRSPVTIVALLLTAITILVASCGTFYESDYPKKQDQYIDERTGQPVPTVPEEDYGKQWPQNH
jgi:hypothetical protein